MHLKTLARVAVAAPLAGALLLSPPAHAASYTIAVGAGALGSATRATFTNTDCNPEGPAKQLNGTDGRFVDVASMAGKLVRVTWTAAAPGGTFFPRLYTAGCDFISNSGNPGQFISPTNLRIPLNTKWLVMDVFQNANISFTLTVVG